MRLIALFATLAVASCIVRPDAEQALRQLESVQNYDVQLHVSLSFYSLLRNTSYPDEACNLLQLTISPLGYESLSRRLCDIARTENRAAFAQIHNTSRNAVHFIREKAQGH